MKENLRQQWNEACLQCGIESISVQKAAKIMAVLMIFGNNEAMVMNRHFTADCEYIQKRFHLQGGEVPDATFARYLKEYVADIWGCIRGEKRKQYLRLWSEGETNVEIAERTGASYGTVSSEICRAIKELKMFYQKDMLYEKEKPIRKPKPSIHRLNGEDRGTRKDNP